MNILGSYINGNYKVIMLSDGTKIRLNNEDKFVPEKPESIDLKITNYCDMNCPFCHEGSSENGIHGDIMHLKFIDTLNPFTEIAIGGGNPLSHPDLDEFLSFLYYKNIIANMTVNIQHFRDNYERLKLMSEDGVIKGLGISATDRLSETDIAMIRSISNSVVHVINGVTRIQDLYRMSNRGLKVLILGYKNFRRGGSYLHNRSVHDSMSIMHSYIKTIIDDKWFNVISFDNLAIKQLDIDKVISPDEFNKMYMGDDGQFTMYIDAVEGKFCKSSVVKVDKRYDLMDDIADMFRIVREGC